MQPDLGRRSSLAAAHYLIIPTKTLPPFREYTAPGGSEPRRPPAPCLASNADPVAARNNLQTCSARGHGSRRRRAVEERILHVTSMLPCPCRSRYVPFSLPLHPPPSTPPLHPCTPPLPSEPWKHAMPRPYPSSELQLCWVSPILWVCTEPLASVCGGASPRLTAFLTRMTMWAEGPLIDIYKSWLPC
ncbi:uncharacterized protein B0H64DRAFT_34888 [Chaetomium fimeti]|uniref:Uncharacterized protein n=1 Tax=Chaetomium fimeti TaxID=1854472 RepID=A0AAE0LXL5_9PEZI|nr:hypothetical protein B0H64DRAFT_34888 [Chaetomium fimeti]